MEIAKNAKENCWHFWGGVTRHIRTFNVYKKGMRVLQEILSGNREKEKEVKNTKQVFNC